MAASGDVNLPLVAFELVEGNTCLLSLALHAGELMEGEPGVRAS